MKNFADKETHKVYQQKFSKQLPPTIQRLALRKLLMIDHAETINDLSLPPAGLLRVK
ncbi:type II toxin-antitoxin system RelE/ParE family toxin [Lactiplantibacillus plantarum]|uniref:type II toxin-antitoxin system RelE/ParE family toxin n=1 Tax=Lactiplantibacillus plantarum TaxID=1590 RepID=UPI003B431E88